MSNGSLRCRSSRCSVWRRQSIRWLQLDRVCQGARETRILAVESGLVFVAVLGVGVPLLLSEGLSGYAVGILAGTLVALGVRLVYLTRLFPALNLVNHVLGAVIPTILAAGAVLLGRATLPSGGGATHWCGALGYAAIALAATWATERVLLKEAFGYLRRAARPATPA